MESALPSHGLRKPVSPPCQPAEVAQAPKPQSIASAGHKDLLFVDTVATVTGPGLLDPPESTPSDTDTKQVLSPAPDARRSRSPDPQAADGSDVLMKMPKVVWTYTRKIKHKPLVRKDISTKSPTQSFTHQGGLLDGLLDDGSDTPTEQLASKGNPNIRPAKKRTSKIAVKRKQQTLQDDEELRRENRSEVNADVVTGENNSKTKRKRRRAPVNQLALKSYDSDNVIDPLNGSVNEQVSPMTTSPVCPRSRKPMKANVGKPVTRIRKEITIPQRKVSDRGRFKVLPSTPRATKSPGWRLGSGFDGVTMESSTNMRPQASRKRNVDHARTPRFLGQSLPELELSIGSSPTRQFPGPRGIPTRRENPCSPVETKEFDPVRKLGTADGAGEGGLVQRPAKIGGEAAFVHVANSVAPIHPLIRNDQCGTASSSHYHDIVREPFQLQLSQCRDLAASQTIREPSKSERNGWLKRRKVDFAVADDDEERLFIRTQTISVNGSGDGRKGGRDRIDNYLKDPTQVQHAAATDLQAFNGGEQSTQNPQRSQKQGLIQDEPSAEQHRRRVSHDVEVGSSDSEEAASNNQSLDMPPEPRLSLDYEANFPTLACHPAGLSVPKAKYSIEVPRTSEVPETQKVLQESIELDAMRTELLNPDRHPYQMSKTTLDSGGYFSKAVQQLEFPETVQHTITRRRSRQMPDLDASGLPVMSRMQKGLSHYANVAQFTGEQRPQKQEGILQLGVTPRLERRMSNMPFRPPFMESL